MGLNILEGEASNICEKDRLLGEGDGR